MTFSVVVTLVHVAALLFNLVAVRNLREVRENLRTVNELRRATLRLCPPEARS